MSLQREKFKLAYNRAKNKSDSDKELLNNLRNEDMFYEYLDQYEDEMLPSMREIRWGILLTFLKKLRITTAKDLLNRWYW